MLSPYIIIPSVFSRDSSVQFNADDFTSLLPGERDRLIIHSGAWRDEYNSLHEFDEIVLDVIFDASRVKNIVQVDMGNGDGPLNMFVSTKGWNITISGILLATNDGQFPQEIYESLLAIESARVSLNVTCRYLNSKGIYHIVIAESHWPQQPGGASSQVFQFTAYSDKPYEIILQENEN